jgi:hypothetical protein
VFGILRTTPGHPGRWRCRAGAWLRALLAVLPLVVLLLGAATAGCSPDDR